MRLWSINFKYLDSIGLIALWRETLLAKNVLEGNTKGYKNHPQLIRFKNSKNPILNINYYLSEIYIESVNRGYHFDESKFEKVEKFEMIKVTNKQIEYEFKHLLNKLKIRDYNLYEKFRDANDIEVCNLFEVVLGDIEDWEVVK